MKTALLALALLAAIPAHAAAVCDGVVADPARDRSIPVRVRMPEGGAARAPVILFSHGLGGSVDGGTALAEGWARAGFLVIHVQHPGSDSEVWKGKGNPKAALTTAANGRQLMDRAGDMKRVADAVESGLQIGACDLKRGDPARMGAAGHSFGAHTVLAIAGQSFGPLGTRAADPRFKAIAALSPMPPRNDAANAKAAFGGIRIPVLAATGSEDNTPFAKGKSLSEITAARASVFEALPPSRTGQASIGLWIDGADHAALSGGGGRAGATPNRHATAVLSAATTAFFQANLGGTGKPDLTTTRALLAPGDRLSLR
ncbi:dienelactone hydrolase [Sandaracinobacter neustonicus]|uniref:Dienelactone hydrolase n=1 Tax=Sandaracinobacter neustonicus TaxID=1715348 RepID=A0A501XW91_9SPHN|nr:dienelactone hydrolase [Sandaracinobacter neustonicus]TPE65042.1 dienelactone hydrolase [Sandaracinobacter neustonicus]